MISIGAYRTGTDPRVDAAIAMREPLKRFLTQGAHESFDLGASHQELVRVPGAAVVHHSDIWVLTHKDLRLSARLRAAREVIADEFALLVPQLDSRVA